MRVFHLVSVKKAKLLEIDAVLVVIVQSLEDLQEVFKTQPDTYKFKTTHEFFERQIAIVILVKTAKSLSKVLKFFLYSHMNIPN